MLYSFGKMLFLLYATAICVMLSKNEDCEFLSTRLLLWQCDSMFRIRLTDGYSREQLESRLRWWIDQVQGTSRSDNTDPIRDRIILVARAVTGSF